MKINDAHFVYFLVLAGVIIFPLLFSFTRKFYFIRHLKKFVLASIPVALFFIVWDIFFTSQNVWWFNEDYITGFKIFNLPIEEILFFFVIPYACVFTFFNIVQFDKYIPVDSIPARVFFTLIFVLSLILSVIYNEQWYTFSTFLILSYSLFFFLFLYYDQKFLKYFLIEYVLILPFFLLSNGILTGSFWVENPVVYYNDNHHLGIRIFNIPIVDFFYGMLMLLWISYIFYEQLKKENIMKNL